MGSRIYTSFFDNVSISAVQDIFSIKAGAAGGLEIHQIDLSAGGVTSPAELRMLMKVAPVTCTQGTGGTAPVMSAVDSGDTKAAAAVVRANDVTTQMTSSGTIRTIQAHFWNVLLPWQYLPAPEDREVIIAAEGFALVLPAAPTAVLVSGTIKWREFS